MAYIAAIMKRETVAYCQLNRVFGFNPVIGRKLAEAAGSALNVFYSKDKHKWRLPASINLGGLEQDRLDSTEEELEKLASKGCNFVSIEDKGYPRLLKECEDAPLGLYIKSKTPAESLFSQKKAIAIVGTRDVSHYGLEWCQRITEAVAGVREKPLIVSGLALGTDIMAHRTALKASAPTVAVMATGIDTVYPGVHSYDAERIVEAPFSALITDYPPGTSPISMNFLRRNRIIAGTCDAVILIESKIHGGGLMTANLAYSYNREVFALPGKADDIRSAGCNKLISEKKAEMIFTLEDLMEKLGYPTSGHRGKASAPPDVERVFSGRLDGGTIDLLKAVTKIIYGNRGISKVEICQKSGLTPKEINSLVSLLEVEGIVRCDLLGNCSIQNRLV